ncbi:MAG: hypothetical protein GTN74_04820, partial [Proteobacteria bacterium]|nr:hypothetical protein [Pseudomonadota bacterium]NIS68786.1 hypothetical protein [Pseudomonadota bacterium]
MGKNYDNSPLRVVGKSVKRIGALERVLGEAEFSDDFFADEILHLKILRSPKHHARIAALDVEQASKQRGVVRILTAKDVPGRN